jgi:hypothetical protein
MFETRKKVSLSYRCYRDLTAQNHATTCGYHMDMQKMSSSRGSRFQIRPQLKDGSKRKEFPIEAYSTVLISLMKLYPRSDNCDLGFSVGQAQRRLRIPLVQYRNCNLVVHCNAIWQTADVETHFLPNTRVRRSRFCPFCPPFLSV